MAQSIKGQTAILFFFIGPNNINLAEDIEILLPVNFHFIPFSCFRGGQKYISQSVPLGHLDFLIVPINTNLIGDVKIKRPIKFH